MRRLHIRLGQTGWAIVAGWLFVCVPLGRPLLAEGLPPLAQAPLWAEQARDIQQR